MQQMQKLVTLNILIIEERMEIIEFNSIQEVRIRVKKFFKKEKGKIKITKITNMKTKTKNSKIYF